LSDTIEALIDEFARHSPGYTDTVLLVDSTPVETCRSRETVKRGGASSLDDALANAADYGIPAMDVQAPCFVRSLLARLGKARGPVRRFYRRLGLRPAVSPSL
jgi:hypothetical protein